MSITLIAYKKVNSFGKSNVYMRNMVQSSESTLMKYTAPIQTFSAKYTPRLRREMFGLGQRKDSVLMFQL